MVTLLIYFLCTFDTVWLAPGIQRILYLGWLHSSLHRLDTCFYADENTRSSPMPRSSETGHLSTREQLASWLFKCIIINITIVIFIIIILLLLLLLQLLLLLLFYYFYCYYYYCYYYCITNCCLWCCYYYVNESAQDKFVFFYSMY